MDKINNPLAIKLVKSVLTLSITCPLKQNDLTLMTTLPNTLGLQSVPALSTRHIC